MALTPATRDKLKTINTTTLRFIPAREDLKGRPIIGLYPATEQQLKDDFTAWRELENR